MPHSQVAAPKLWEFADMLQQQVADTSSALVVLPGCGKAQSLLSHSTVHSVHMDQLVEGLADA